MQNYIDLLKDIKNNGVHKSSRAGDTLSVFGRQLRWNMKDGFPLMTIKKVSFHNIAHELLWFLGAFDDEWEKFGNSNVRYLLDHNVNIWNDDTYRGYLEYLDFYHKKYNEPELDYLVDDPHENRMRPFTQEELIQAIKDTDGGALTFGELGHTYGKQWRKWGLSEHKNGIDQISNLIDQLKNNPSSRRHLVTAWNPLDVDSLTLPPCHYGFSLNVEPITKKDAEDMVSKEIQIPVNMDEINDLTTWMEKNAPDLPKYKLSLMWRQRSVDTFLGLPYNIASYGLLLHMIAHLTNMIPNDLVGSLEDTHVYINQMDAINELLSREGTEPQLPTLELVNLDKIKTIDDFRFDNFKINDYYPLPTIKASLNVGL